ncbi:hypothetical protein DID88_001175 [Monilinia fructigena]|uniref:Solute carrier family 40 member n=1 Tax=Monilinia fructigena TaxID=38457 RepID=A0A395IZ32_9HELO|nr:hypothetical protein DID88_001175 [Monilinia fructigena]
MGGVMNLRLLSSRRMYGLRHWLLLLFVEAKNGSGGNDGVPLLKVVADEASSGDTIKIAIFVLILGFGILEGLSASGNMLSMERDWVVTAAAPEGRAYDLTHLNAAMRRRIDLIYAETYSG